MPLQKLFFNLMAPESGVLVLGQFSNDYIGEGGVFSTNFFGT